MQNDEFWCDSCEALTGVVLEGDKFKCASCKQVLAWLIESEWPLYE